jgi:hypothetical protein
MELSADDHGNTCIRTMPGDTASIVVTELLGDGSYQVKPGDGVVFRTGQVKQVYRSSGDCGCPGPANTLSAQPSQAAAAAQKPQVAAAASAPAEANSLAETPAQPAQPSMPASQNGDVHVTVDAPFVFSAISPGPDFATVATLRIEGAPTLPEPVVIPWDPNAQPKVETAQQKQSKQQQKGFFQSLKGFFKTLFGG